MFALVVLLALTSSAFAGDLNRNGKNLRGVFPFNAGLNNSSQNHGHHGDHGHHGGHHGDHEDHHGDHGDHHGDHGDHHGDHEDHHGDHGDHHGDHGDHHGDHPPNSQSNLRPNQQNDARRASGRLGQGQSRNAVFLDNNSVSTNKLQRGAAAIKLPDRNPRQRNGDDVPLDIGSIAAAGERCIDKVVVVEETEYDDVIECKHSYSERCHITFTTDFEPQQEEECNENFVKNCFIEYRKVATNEKVQFCNTPLICEGEGPEECRTVYESQCTTSFHVHDVVDDIVECRTVYEEKCEDVTQGYTTEQKCTRWPKQECDTRQENVQKVSPRSECKKVPKELCGPSGCELRAGPEECYDRTEAAVQEVPEETCTLEPQKECKHVTKLVPHLKEAEECVDIPTEVCSRSRVNPRKVQKPVVKKWCYVPTAESGLA